MGPGQVPGTATAAGGVSREPRAYSQCNQCRAATAGGFRLSPQYGVPQYPCRRQNLLCPLLTSALRSGCLSTSSVTEATQDSSPGVSSTAFRAQSPALRSASLMEVDFAVRSPLVRSSRLITGFCPSTRTFAPRFLQTSLQTSNLAPSIALAFCYPSPPSGWGRTFTSKLLNMPSTLRSRWRGGRGGLWVLHARFAIWSS